MSHFLRTWFDSVESGFEAHHGPTCDLERSGQNQRLQQCPSYGYAYFLLDWSTASLSRKFLCQLYLLLILLPRFTWGIEMTCMICPCSIFSLVFVSPCSYRLIDFTPYLLQLGLEKSQTSLVWIAPPLSGLIVQPIVGIVSDSSTLRWGRRRPYMLFCALLVASFLLILGWASEIVGIFVSKEALVSREHRRF